MTTKIGFFSHDYKIKEVYYCNICNYSTLYRSNFDKHKNTKKCKIANAKYIYTPIGDSKLWICACGKKYKHQSGLSRHKIYCLQKQEILQKSEPPIISNTSDIIKKKDTSDMKDMFLHIIEENKELRRIVLKQQDQIGGILPKIGNITNNTFNVKVFLNNECKDALNITEFLDTLCINEKDLVHTKKYGLCEGISNILMNGLKDLGTYKRPIHCTDTKRETLYIKDNNEWEKEENTNKLRETLHLIADKQRLAITNWENMNPGWENTESGKLEWVSLVKQVMETTDTINNNTMENKIIKNIVKEIKI